MRIYPDIPMIVKIMVDDVLNGKPGSPRECYLARALLRRKDVADVYVRVSRVLILFKKDRKEGAWTEYRTHHRDRPGLKEFDSMHQVDLVRALNLWKATYGVRKPFKEITLLPQYESKKPGWISTPGGPPWPEDRADPHRRAS